MCFALTHALNIRLDPCLQNFKLLQIYTQSTCFALWNTNYNRQKQQRVFSNYLVWDLVLYSEWSGYVIHSVNCCHMSLLYPLNLITVSMTDLFYFKQNALSASPFLRDKLCFCSCVKYLFIVSLWFCLWQTGFCFSFFFRRGKYCCVLPRFSIYLSNQLHHFLQVIKIKVIHLRPNQSTNDPLWLLGEYNPIWERTYFFLK